MLSPAKLRMPPSAAIFAQRLEAWIARSGRLKTTVWRRSCVSCCLFMRVSRR